MNDKNVQKWIDALRSGKYQQGKGFLARDGKFCCLGVACEIYQSEGPGDLHVTTQQEDDNDQTKYGFVTYFDGNDLVLPEKVQDWLGLDSEVGYVLKKVYVSEERDGPTLTMLNDTDTPFDIIAKVIEEGIVE